MLELPHGPITAVTGYWAVKSKHNHSEYYTWFSNSLLINAPYIVFGSEPVLSRFQEIRKDLATTCYQKRISEFSTYRIIQLNNQKTHPKHCPSVDLGRIWLEKINLVGEASELNPYDTEWFAWIDSGFSTYRSRKPPANSWPSPEKLHLLSKSAVNYSQSQPYHWRINDWGYAHCVSAGALIFHVSMIEEFKTIFYRYVKKCIEESDSYVCLSEQCILSRILSDYPELFNRIGKGYGKAVVTLY